MVVAIRKHIRRRFIDEGTNLIVFSVSDMCNTQITNRKGTRTIVRLTGLSVPVEIDDFITDEVATNIVRAIVMSLNARNV
jgi:hypothetical protein